MGCAASQNTKPQSAAKLMLTYWSLHGLGAAPRMALHCSGADFDDVLVAGADRWGEQSKAIGGEKNALVNLPFLTTAAGEVIVQSQAVLRHIGRTQGLYGATAKDAARVDQVMDVCSELRTELYKMAYAPAADFAAMKASFAAVSLPYYYGSLERFMLDGGTKHAAADAVTVADFVLVDLMQLAAEVYGGDAAVFGAYPALLAYLRAFVAKPEMASWYASESFKLPKNAPGANFSAAASL